MDNEEYEKRLKYWETTLKPNLKEIRSYLFHEQHQLVDAYNSVYGVLENIFTNKNIAINFGTNKIDILSKGEE